MFKLEIATDNDAFRFNNHNAEISRILQEVAKAFEYGDENGICRDVNGKKVGTWKYEPEED
jgi:hypothetical protein